MKIQITASPVFHLPLTASDVRLLRELAAAHYDSVCKAAGVLGGFLYGWSNMLSCIEDEPASAEPRTVDATWRNIDTTLKILEMAGPVLHGREDAMAQARQLSRDLFEATARWRLISPTWTAEIETAPASIRRADAKEVHHE